MSLGSAQLPLDISRLVRCVGAVVMGGAWGRGFRGSSRVCCRSASRVFVTTFSFGHSRVILMWGFADDRWVYEEARTDSSVRVSVEKDGVHIAGGDRCSLWSGLRDEYGSW